MSEQVLSEEESWGLAQLGHMLYLRRRDQEAEAIFGSLARLGGPQTAYAWYVLGLLARRRGDWQRAQELLQHATKTGEDSPAVQLALAEVLLHNGQSKAAADWLDSVAGALELDAGTARRAAALRRRWFGR